MKKIITTTAIALSAMALTACGTSNGATGTDFPGGSYDRNQINNNQIGGDDVLDAGWPIIESQFTDAYWYEFCNQWRVMPEVAWQDFLYGWNMTNGGQGAGDPSEASFTRNMQNTCARY